MRGFDALLKLRALREDRAARATAAAMSRLDAARWENVRATEAVDRHDHAAEVRETRLHDAMIAGDFNLADLRRARDRAFHDASGREKLIDVVTTSQDVIRAAANEAEDKGRDLRQAILRHEKLKSVAIGIAATTRRQTDARIEDEGP